MIIVLLEAMRKSKPCMTQLIAGSSGEDVFHIEAGILQGSVIRPCLFIDDLARELDVIHRNAKA